MPAVDFTESIVELAALEWFGELDYTIGHGPDSNRAGATNRRVDGARGMTQLNEPTAEEAAHAMSLLSIDCTYIIACDNIV